ncbi:MAG: hypothetical protein FVQ85_04045 [Planctomycetes bacterium]|nr:hypothetical protein [Planctomycetota bacterium]
MSEIKNHSSAEQGVGDSRPRYIFIAGTPRSGGSVTLASLDDHPDLLAWPNEFLYFPFFYQVAKGRQEVPVCELNQKLLNVSFAAFRKRLQNVNGIYVQDSLSSTHSESYNIGDFDYQVFLENLESVSDEHFTAVGYLDFLFECLKKANRKYRDKQVKYNVLLTGARGFDWNNNNLLETSMFLFSYREAEDSYASLRERRLRKAGLNMLFSPAGKKSLLYWVETYRRISDYAKDHIDHGNFLVVPLKNLQADSDEFLRKICAFLSIKPYPSIYDLSVCGAPYKGNASEGNLNRGKIAKRTSKPRTPLCSFEKRAFALVDLFDFSEGKPRKMPPFGLVEMIQKAFSSAFSEIPAENITKRISLPVGIFFERVLMFFKLCLIYPGLKNTWLKMKFIKKSNLHVINNPFWTRIK